MPNNAAGKTRHRLGRNNNNDINSCRVGIVSSDGLAEASLDCRARPEPHPEPHPKPDPQPHPEPHPQLQPFFPDSWLLPVI